MVEENAAAGSGTLGIRPRHGQPWKIDAYILPLFQDCCDVFLPKAVVAARPSLWSLLFRACGAKPRRPRRYHGGEDVTCIYEMLLTSDGVGRVHPRPFEEEARARAD